MKASVRILMIVILAAFAAGTVVHAASAAVMTVKMALADSGSMDGADCDGCSGDDEGAPSCDGICVAPLLAMANPGAALHVDIDAQTRGAAMHDAVGRTGPPDPSPPRSIVLS